MVPREPPLAGGTAQREGGVAGMWAGDTAARELVDVFTPKATLDVVPVGHCEKQEQGHRRTQDDGGDTTPRHLHWNGGASGRADQQRCVGEFEDDGGWWRLFSGSRRYHGTFCCR